MKHRFVPRDNHENLHRRPFMTTQEVADSLVKSCAEGKFQEATENLYSPDIVSMEAGAPPGGSRESKGIEAVRGKGEWWNANHAVHSVTVDGPIVAGSHFAVTFKMDVTFKPQNKRFTMEEVALYKVDNGKIVYEEFFYAM
jgi:ketosteroid isomerase-like protein